MRLPLAIPLDARTGNGSKDARLTNAVVETYEGQTIVTQRPGLSELDVISGAANGVVCFDGSLISLYGTAANTSEQENILYELGFEGTEGGHTSSNSGTGGTTTLTLNYANTTSYASVGSSALGISQGATDYVSVGTVIPKAIIASDWEVSFDARYSSTGLIDVSASPSDVGLLSPVFTQDTNSDIYQPSIDVQWLGVANQIKLLVGYNSSPLGSITVAPDVFQEIKFRVRSGSGQWYVNGAAVGTAATVSQSLVYANNATQLLQTADFDLVYSTTDKNVVIDNYVFRKLYRLVGISGAITSGQYDFAQSTE